MVDANTSSAARHAARMAAVQALYQMELTNADAEEVAHEFIEHRFGGEATLVPSANPTKDSSARS